MHGGTTKGMTIRHQSQSYSRMLRSIGVGMVVLFGACSDRQPRTSDAVSEPRATPAVREFTPTAEPARERGSVGAVATPKPRAVVEDVPSDPAEIAKEFRAATDVDRKGELVEALWSLDSPAAVETLRQLFLTERDQDVKIDMIAGISDSKKPETREGRFGLVVSALAPGQPKDVRELAAQMLVDFDDPRAIGLLQQFAQDADPEMREAAKEALETRRAMEQP
jgi:HEAT repeat protein